MVHGIAPLTGPISTNSNITIPFSLLGVNFLCVPEVCTLSCRIRIRIKERCLLKSSSIHWALIKCSSRHFTSQRSGFGSRYDSGAEAQGALCLPLKGLEKRDPPPPYRMADCFDLLPDEVVIKILSGVTWDDEGDEGEEGTARIFVWMQCVCKRFLQLSRAVESLEWPLFTLEQATGLTNLLQHEEVELTHLNLAMTYDEVEELPWHRIFTNKILKHLPASIQFFVMSREEVQPDPEVDISRLIARLLRSPVLRDLRMTNAWIENLPVVRSLPKTPPSRLRSLDLDGGIFIRPEALQHLISRCPDLEKLEVLISESEDRWFPSNSPEVVSVRSKSLKHLKLGCGVKLVARIEAACLLTLESSANRLVLATPKLQKLSVDMRSGVEQPPLELLEPFHLEHLCMNGLEASLDWESKVVSILRQCPDLHVLELHTGRCGPSSNEVTLKQLLSYLPTRLASLKIRIYRIDPQEIDEALQTALVHNNLDSLVILALFEREGEREPDTETGRLFRFRRAFSNLQTLKIVERAGSWRDY